MFLHPYQLVFGFRPKGACHEEADSHRVGDPSVFAEHGGAVHYAPRSLLAQVSDHVARVSWAIQTRTTFSCSGDHREEERGLPLKRE